MSTDYGADNRHDDDLPSVDRLLALSDGVVAIALTLLVLQLAVPSLSATRTRPPAWPPRSARPRRPADQLRDLVLRHRPVLADPPPGVPAIVGQREGLAWWNFAFLFTITIMPFTSDLLGEYSENPLAVDIFAANLLLATLATQATVHLRQTPRPAGPWFARPLPGGPDCCVRWDRNGPPASMGLAWVNAVTRNSSGSCSPGTRISSTGGCAAIPVQEPAPAAGRPAGRGRPARLRVSAGA